MALITNIQPTDLITNSRAVLNNNFSALNTDKIETSVLDTDTTLSDNSDTKVATQKAVKAYVDAGGTADNLTRFVPTGSIFPYGAATAPTHYLMCDGGSISTTTYAGLFAVLGYAYGGSGSLFNVPDLKARMPLGYSASAPTKVFTFSSRSSNTITVTGVSNTNNNEIQTGQLVNFVSTGTTIAGLTSGVDYYLIRVAYNQFTLATSVANANAGTVITLSGDGTGTRTFTATFSARALGDMGGEENHAITDNEMPSHTHSISEANGSGNGPGFASVSDNNTSGYGSQTAVVASSAGSDAIHNNMPLFTVVNYIIKI